MIDVDLPLVFTRQQSVARGLTQHAVDWRLTSGMWRPLRRGVFCTTATHQASTAEQRHLLGALAVLLSTDTPEVMSHLTAALAYGWPAPPIVDPDPWTTVSSELPKSTRRRHGRVRQVAPLPVTQTSSQLGLALTSPSRTVADCLRHFAAEVSVPIADAAIRGGADAQAIAAVLAGQDGWPYAARARASLPLVDGRRESWLESRSAVTFQRQGIAQPVPQVDIFDERGRHVARVDFLWPDLGVIGEADGWGKYSALSPLDEPLEVLRAEKRREDLLRGLGYEVARWTAAELGRPESTLVPQLHRAMARARPDRIRGSRRTTRPLASPGVQADGLRALTKLSPLGQLVIPVTTPYSLRPGQVAS
jgi:hypothetical protein